MIFRTPFDPDPSLPDDASADAVLRARIAAVPQPTLPPGLAERIVREVPRLAQLPAPTRAVSGRTAPEIAQVPISAVSMAHAVGGPPARRGKPWAGLAALAAGIAAVALIGQQVMPVGPAAVPLRLGKTAPLRPIAPGPVVLAKAASAHAIPGPVARAPKAVDIDDGGDDGGQVDPAPSVEPASVGPASVERADRDHADDVAGVAVAAAGPAAGPADTPSGVPTALGAHGVMGPTLPQGYGFTGGDFGMAYPGAMGAGSRGAGPGPH
jgi:hypothetical protein